LLINLINIDAESHLLIPMQKFAHLMYQCRKKGI